QQEFAVAVRSSAPQLRRLRWRVLPDPSFARVVNPDDDQRLHLPGVNLRIGRLSHVPILSLNKRGRAVEKVLSIVEIQHGKPPVRLLEVAGREIQQPAPLDSQAL